MQRFTQSSHHKKNISSRNMKLFKEEAMFQKVVNLQVFLLNIQFSDGLIRCNVWLKYAEFLPYDARFPVILPRDSLFTRLIVWSYHEENNHSAGTNHLLPMLLRRFWVVAGQEVIKEYTNHCMICKKNKAALASQIMAPLPQIRLKFNIRAFSNVGIDFAGPFLTKHGWGKTRNKR